VEIVYFGVLNFIRIAGVLWQQKHCGLFISGDSVYGNVITAVTLKFCTFCVSFLYHF